MATRGQRHGAPVQRPAIGARPQPQNDRNAAVSQAQQEIWDLILREQQKRRATGDDPNAAQRQSQGGVGPREIEGQQATRAPGPRQQNRDRFAAQREQMRQDEELARRLSEGVDQGPLAAPVPRGRRPAPRAAQVPPTPTAAPRATTQTPVATDGGTAIGSECPMCMTTTSPDQIFRTPCNHTMCLGCLEGIFRRATREREHYPPRCCPRTEIHVNSVRHLLPVELVRNVEQKAAEFSTDNPTYCSRRQCSAFIDPAQIRETVAWCPQCRNQTCVMCKQAHHPGRDCPHDPARAQVEALAEEKGWAHCPQCNQIVDRGGGCCHIM